MTWHCRQRGPSVEVAHRRFPHVRLAAVKVLDAEFAVELEPSL
jgi:hypothetical protein